MEIVVSGRHTEVPERFRRLAQEKLAKVGQLAPKAHRVDVELSHERNPRQSHVCEKVEITVRGKGPVIRAEACAEDPAAALDLAMGRLLERLRRSGDRRKVHHGRQTPASVRVGSGETVTPAGGLNGAALDGAGLDGAALDGASLDGVSLDGVSLDGVSLDGAAFNGAALDSDRDGASPVVIRTKDHDAVPMTLDQALYEMELVGHDFYLFVDAASRRPSVVYRRHGWNYGVIRLAVADPGVAGG